MLNNVILNEQECLKQWSGFITESTGITDRAKLSWMSRYCEFHSLTEKAQLNESAHGYAHLNPNMNVGGMGAIKFPTATAYNTAADGRGSGDNPFSLLPLAVQVAAQTIALDLVPVVPMQGPLGILQYMDYVYEGGKLNHDPDFAGDYASKTAPLMVKLGVDWDGSASDADVKKYPDASDAEDEKFAPGDVVVEGLDGYNITFIAYARIDGKLICKVDEKAYTKDVLIQGGEGAPAPLWKQIIGKKLKGKSGVITSIDTVKAMEDFIPGFSGAGLKNNEPLSAKPYSREEGESTPSNMMSLNTFTLEVKADTIQVKGAITREQMQDLKAYGIDAVAQVEAALVNELTQHINRDILNRLWKLGLENAENVARLEHINLNTFFSVDDAEAAPAGYMKSYVGGGAETLGTIQRRVMSKLLAASNVIAVRGRRGAANFAVVSGFIATALQDCAGFVAYPLSNTVNQTAGSLYPVGAISGITIYVDPSIPFGVSTVLVGRKGKDNEPGLVFMPYLMADKLSYPSEGMEGAPVTSLKSRYAIVAAGHHPETMYLTFDLQFGNGVTLY